LLSRTNSLSSNVPPKYAGVIDKPPFEAAIGYQLAGAMCAANKKYSIRRPFLSTLCEPRKTWNIEQTISGLPGHSLSDGLDGSREYIYHVTSGG
jgi:hypothetical protein